MSDLHPLTARQYRNSKIGIGPLSPVASIESQILTGATTKAAYYEFARPAQTIVQQLRPRSVAKPLEEQLFDTKAACKILTNQFAMHFGEAWQKRFFVQLDALMELEDWDRHDTPVTEASFTTLLRVLLLLKDKRRPGLGIANDGQIVAAWTKGANRLTLQCLPADGIRWVVSIDAEGELETAAGHTSLSDLMSRLAPYNPNQWFTDEGQKPTA